MTHACIFKGALVLCLAVASLTQALPQATQPVHGNAPILPIKERDGIIAEAGIGSEIEGLDELDRDFLIGRAFTYTLERLTTTYPAIPATKLRALQQRLARVSPPANATSWKQLAIGLELGWVTAKVPSAVGNSRIAIVRLDPRLCQLEVLGVGPGETAPLTARNWAKRNGLAVAINAGMFDPRNRHLGALVSRGESKSPAHRTYLSVAAFDPRDPEHHPAFRLFDLDTPGTSLETIRKDYASLVQNLRLVKRPGVNRWSAQAKRWSEALLGEDDQGRALLVFSRSPFSMRDLVRELIDAGTGLVAAQHLEGGPEAQLFIKAGDEELELFGSYETGFREDDGNSSAWPVPYVLAVRTPRAGAGR